MNARPSRVLAIAFLLAGVVALGRALGAQTAQEPAKLNPHVREVIVVFKTHFDIGYTDMASNVVQRYRTTMIDAALQVVDQNKGLPAEQQFAWTVPGWPMTKISEDWPGQTPERSRRIVEALRHGRFVVHALPFTTHTESLEIEDLVQGLGYASRLSRSVGLPLPRDAKMTDVPSHSWILPTLLRNAGVDFLHLGCNPASTSPQVPRLFFWEGPDGSRLLTMYSAESYGTGLVPPADWPYKTWLALIHTGDNHGPPTPAEVKSLLEEAARTLPAVSVRIGRLSDFSDAILADKAEVPVVRGDMPDTWIHGPMSNPQGAKLARNTRPAIATAESLKTMLGVWGVALPDARGVLAKARERSLLYGEHTWGGAQSWVTAYGSGTKWAYGEAWKADEKRGRFQRLEDSWAEHTSYIEASAALAGPLLERELDALAKAVHQDGARLVVFNPLPWKREQGVGSVRFPDGGSAAGIDGAWLTPVGARSRQAFAPVVKEGDELRFSLGAVEVPAMGYTTLVSTDKAPRAAAGDKTGPPQTTVNEVEGSVAAGEQRVRFDSTRGTILTHSSVPVGKTDAVGYGFGQILYERFDSNNVAGYVRDYVKIDADWAINELGKPSMPPASMVPYRASSPTNFTVRYSASTIAAEAVMEAPASEAVPFGVTTRYVIYAGEPFFDLEVTIHDKPADPWPEAAWICLPFDVDSPQFRLGRQGSIVDPSKDLVPGSNHNLQAVDTGGALFDPKGKGAAFCAVDSPLVSLDEPGCWKYSRDFVPKRPVVFINLFNNQWTTNFRMWSQGTWTSRVRIWRFNKFDAARDLVRPALEARYPLRAVFAQGAGGGLPVIQSGVEVSRPGVMVTEFGPNPDGVGTLLRLWELAGRSGNIRVKLPEGAGVTSVQPIDLRGRPVGNRIAVRGGGFEFTLNAFKPASFELY